MKFIYCFGEDEEFEYETSLQQLEFALCEIIADAGEEDCYEMNKQTVIYFVEKLDLTDSLEVIFMAELKEYFKDDAYDKYVEEIKWK